MNADQPLTDVVDSVKEYKNFQELERDSTKLMSLLMELNQQFFPKSLKYLAIVNTLAWMSSFFAYRWTGSYVWFFLPSNMPLGFVFAKMMWNKQRPTNT
jgi:hypothetical protein